MFSQNENPQRWIDSQLNSASFKTDFKLKWQKKSAANTPLALINKVDFKIVRVKYNLDDNYAKNIEIITDQTI